MKDFNFILNCIKAADKPLIIALDGRAASGKTTLANRISAEFNACVIRMDDFFLPSEKRTQERFSQAGGNVDYERFAAEVLPNLKSHVAFQYGVFDCSEMKINGFKSVLPADVIVVEGAYSLHPYFGDYADIKVFVTVEKEEQLKRIAKRNGQALLKRFKNEWIPMEEMYFKACLIPDKCDYTITLNNI